MLLGVLLSVEGELDTEVQALRQMMTAIYAAGLSTGELLSAVEDLAEWSRGATFPLALRADSVLAESRGAR